MKRLRDLTAVLGMVGGQAVRNLDVLVGMTDSVRILTAKLLVALFC